MHTHESDGEQARRWNGPAGHAWVEAQDLLDRLFAPFEVRLADAAAALSPRDVLDVGCGTGGTTLAVARRLGAAGQCTGVDISEPMIAAARARAERNGMSARFICADAQVHAFEAASFDLILSRFGVMFFEDPVAAFANLRRAARDAARLRCIVWRHADENPFMTTAERAAAPLLPNLPARQPDAPGQFAFADAARVSGILADGGWTAIDLHAIDVACVLPEKDLIPYLTRLGPVAMALREVDDEGTRARVVDAARAAFAPYVDGTEVRFTAACWMIGAQAGPARRG